MAEGETSPVDMRVSDGEREHVVALLQKAVARGLLDTMEFDARSGRAARAATRAELNEVLVDLPVEQVGTRHRADAHSSDDVIELDGWLNSITRKGAWRVPRRLVLHRRAGSTELDLTEADIRYSEIEIELDVICGSLEMRVPEGTSVGFDRLSVTAGSTEDHRRAPAATGGLHIEIVGDLRLGSVEVRGPKRGFFRGLRA